MSGRRRIALFGGSFDPPHLGHVLCATYAYAVGDVDAVWVLPVADHPYGKDLQSWELRWQLCQAAFAGLAFVELRDDERRNEGGRTITLIENLQRSHPEVDWVLIGGTDTKRDMPSWYRGKELLELVEILPVPRRGYDDDPAALPDISSTSVRMRQQQGECIDTLVPRRVRELIDELDLYRSTRA